MSEAVRHVGFIGLGRMGAAIARNIMKAGHTLTVYNRTAAKMQPFLDAGAAVAASPAEAAAHADVVITSLMDDRSVLGAVERGDGVLSGLRPGAVHVGTTTVSPRCARTLAALHAVHGSDYVSAPVVGRPDVAEAGQLISFVAGDTGAIARCHAVVSAHSRAVMPVSAPIYMDARSRAGAGHGAAGRDARQAARRHCRVECDRHPHGRDGRADHSRADR